MSVWGEAAQAHGMTMKTAVTILQEMMVKRGLAPEYECIAKEGPAHEAQFTVQCRVAGASASATARSKKEAKQEAARRTLELLAAGALEAAPSPAAPPGLTAPPGPAAPPDPEPELTRTHVALLAELCDHMRLLAPVYEEVSADGPAHSRVFTWSARVGGAARRGVARTKKAARQLAAAALYRHLRDNLPHRADTFDEEAALARAHERAMERYVDITSERSPSALALPLAHYGAALSRSVDEPRRLAALAALEAHGDGEEGAALAAAAAALGLQCSTLVLEVGVHVESLCGANAPPWDVAARSPRDPARAATRLLRQLLRHPAPPAAAPPAAAPPAPPAADAT